MKQLNQKDSSLLPAIAEYRILLIDQIALLNNSGKRIVQRKVSRLFNNGLINLSPRNYSTNFGRPENIISISEKGVKFLQNENLIDNKIPLERLVPDKTYSIEHELLLNWFRIHLNHIPIKNPDLTTDFISSTTPFLPLRRNGFPLISESFKQENREIEFIPDGVFTISSKDQNMSLLFFLEVDMGTESLNSGSLKSNNITTKIKNYRAYFQSEKYKRYEKKWDTKFNGFRLLFLTNSSKRKNSIANLVSSSKLNDFMWVAHQYDMFEKGLGGKIWTRGGNIFTSQESILGPTLNFEERLIQLK